MRRITLLLCLLLSTTVWTFAYDFQSGDLYYNITSDSTTEVTYQKDYSYDNYSGLTSAVIPKSVTYNGTTYSVTSIGKSAFRICRGLTSVTIPNSVTSIEYMAFEGCTGLTSITIPNSVTSIGNYAFGVVANIVYSGTAEGSPWGARSVNGYVDGYLVYSDATKTTLLACSSTATGTITIPNSVTTIGGNAFRYCTGLTSITIPNNVTSIGYCAFSDCSGLTSITIPNSVTSIGNYAFSGCTGLTSATIGNGVTTIGESAFSDCTNLTSVTIPNSVTAIGKSAFSGCTGLTSITIPNSIMTIEGGVFSGCTGLTSITIPNSVTTIEGSAFRDCTSLVSIAIPNSVTTIGTGAFYGCTNLASVVIGNSVTSIGSRAFWQCKGLMSVTCYAVEPPTIKKGAFPKEMGSIPLYVPEESVEKYKAAEVWKDFMDILPIQNTAIDQPTQNPIDNSAQSRKIFHNGQVLILRNGTTYDVIGHQVL